MRKAIKLTEEGRRRERNEKRDDAFRAFLGAFKTMTGMTNAEIAKKLRISARTMDNRVKNPGSFTNGEMRMIGELTPEGLRFPVEVIVL